MSRREFLSEFLKMSLFGAAATGLAACASPGATQEVTQGPAPTSAPADAAMPAPAETAVSTVPQATQLAPTVPPTPASTGDETWATDFPVVKSELVSTGRNPHFILEPGYRLDLRGDGAQLAITVLDETRNVDGVETRVVEERKTEGGKLVEVSRNYFAISKRTNDVFYFGEEVDVYRNDRVVSHTGAWLSGIDGAKFGLIMPGQVVLNMKHHQEIAPGIAMDRARIVSLSETVNTPAGEFTNCLKVEETTPLEPQVREYKYYASGIGLIQDGPLKLVKAGKAGETA